MSRLIRHLKRLDWVIIGSVILLSVIGLVSMYSASSFRGEIDLFQKQVVFIGIGILVMFLMSLVDWRGLRDEPYLLLLLYFLCIALLGMLLLFGQQTRGIRGWYKLGPISFDPLPFTEIILIVLLAKYFSKRHVELYDARHILVSGIYAAIPFLLVFMQPDLGSALLLLAIWGGILLASGVSVRHLLLLFVLALILAGLAWSFALKPYQRSRIHGFLFPDEDVRGIGWSQRQSKIAIGSGGLFGKGFNEGTQLQMGFLTFPQTDFIFSAIAEEFGLLGVLAILSLTLLICVRSVIIAYKFGTNFPRLFAIGFAVIVMFQTFVHAAVNLGLIPVIGLPLPFVSYGGSSLVSYFIGVGILQSLRTHPEK